MGADWRVLAASALGFGAGALLVLSRAAAAGGITAGAMADVDARVDCLSRDWAQLQAALLRISAAELHDARAPLVAGARARIATADEVLNSSLWDADHSAHFGSHGVIHAIDPDGDVEFALDSGNVVTVDIRFVKAIHEHRSIADLADDVDRAVRGLAQGRRARGRHMSTFSAALSTTEGPVD